MTSRSCCLPAPAWLRSSAPSRTPEIAYRAESSALVYGTTEIRDLLAAVRAIDDPTDELSLITALRAPLFACGDDDLFTFRAHHGGAWNHQAPVPDSVPEDHRVGLGMRYLGELHRARYWLTASEILERLVRERRVLELGFAGRRPRDLWRRVRFLIDQARAFEDAEGGSLRDYLRWAQLQSAEGARVAETVLPETDDDSVQIMTIHASKGLEFPICVLSGMTTRAQGRRGGVHVVFPPDGGYGLKLSADVRTDEFEKFQPLDEQMDFHEKLRLLYVAATRARDHLIVSVHRHRRDVADREKATAAELLFEAATNAPHYAQLRAGTRREPDRVDLAPRPPLPERGAWAEERRAALDTSGRPGTVGATTIATKLAEEAAADPALAKQGRDLDLPPWNKGRYGTAVGRAVHAVLQTIDLATGDGLSEASAAQAAAEGVLGLEDTVRALAQSALESPVVKAAAQRQHWRESYVATPVDGSIVEGYVDLLFRDEEGLVVVDYKTDAVPDDDALQAKVAQYRPQAAAYALAVEAAAGEHVDRCVFVFCSPDGAREVVVDDLPNAIAVVREFVGG